MTPHMLTAFRDEVSKIAGEMTGATRTGRKPIGVDRLLEKEIETETKPSDIVKSDIIKTSAKGRVLKALALMGGGAAAYETGRRANKDRKLGKQVRLQNQQQF